MGHTAAMAGGYCAASAARCQARVCGAFGVDAMLVAWEERCVNVRSKFDTQLPHLADGDTRGNGP